MRKGKNNYFSYVFFRLKIVAYRGYYRIVQFFANNPPISLERFCLAKYLSFWEYVIWWGSRRPVLDSLINSLRGLFIFVGFFTIALEGTKKGFPFSVVIAFMFFLLIYTILSTKDSFFYMTSFVTYFCFLSYVYAIVGFSIRDLNLGEYYLRVFIVISIVRPFWFFVLDVFWYLLLRQLVRWEFLENLLLFFNANFRNLEKLEILKKDRRVFFNNAKFSLVLLLIFGSIAAWLLCSEVN